MSKNYKWGIFPGKWGAKAKKAAPRRIKNGAACCETPRRTSAETHPASAAPARRKRYGPFPSTLRGAFVSAEARERQNGIPRTDSRQVGSGREIRLRVDSGHIPHAPPSGADFKTESNVPTSSG